MRFTEKKVNYSIERKNSISWGTLCFIKKYSTVCVASGVDKGLYCFDEQHDYSSGLMDSGSAHGLYIPLYACRGKKSGREEISFVTDEGQLAVNLYCKTHYLQC